MNLWARFKDLLPSTPLLVGEVLAHNPDGTSTLEAPDGAVFRVRGQGVAGGLHAWVRGGVVEGEAPDLPVYEAEV